MTTTINASTSSGLVQTADTSGVLQLQTANTAAVTIDGSQNVGIGTASPSSKLEVQQGTKATTAAVISSARFTTTDASAFGLYFRQKTDATAANRWTGLSSFDNGVGPANLVLQDLGGNVGIATTSPADILDVTRVSSANSTGGLTLTNTDNSGYGSALSWNLKLNSTAGVWGRIAVEAASTTATYMPFYTTASGTLGERMRIDSSGNLLIGTTTAVAGNCILTAVNGVANYVSYLRNTNGSAPYGLYVEYTGAAPNSTSSTAFRFNDTAANRFFVYSNGGIANYSANNVNLSDETLKKDIQDAPNYLDKLCQIPVKTYLYKDQTDTDLNLGVIAQEVKAICPELVGSMDVSPDRENPDIKLAIYETDFKYAMLKAIQEQQALITQLQADVAALKGAK